MQRAVDLILDEVDLDEVYEKVIFKAGIGRSIVDQEVRGDIICEHIWHNIGFILFEQIRFVVL